MEFYDEGRLVNIGLAGTHSAVGGDALGKGGKLLEFFSEKTRSPLLFKLFLKLRR